MGSILAITDDAGTVLEEQSFDPWGRLRNAENWSYTNALSLSLLDRGYTGHQHLYEFGIINMNGRLYDPVLGRMLSPDSYIQLPGFAQNYNRYSYVWNNPLKFTDPSGEWVHILVGAIIGGVINWGMHGFEFNLDGLVAFGIGAAAGAIGAATGGAAFIAAGGGAAGAGGFAAGFTGGAIGSAFSSPIQSIGNSLYFGDPMMTGGEFLTGILLGGVTGGSVNGISALAHGKTFLNSSLKPSTVGISNSTVSLPKLEDPEIRLENPIQRGDVADADINTGSFSDLPEQQTLVRTGSGDNISYRAAQSSANGNKLNEHLYQLEKYGSGGSKVLENGKVRYYSKSSLNSGDNNSFRMVREWNPSNGLKRTWFETLNSKGQIIQIRPQLSTNIKTHYVFDGFGNLIKVW